VDGGEDCDSGRNGPSNRLDGKQSDGARNQDCDAESNRGRSFQSNRENGVGNDGEGDGGSNTPRNQAVRPGDAGGDFPAFESTT
jgi:hypothetical protein